MERLLKISFLSLLVFAGCAKSPGFKAEDYTYEVVQNPVIKDATKNPQAPAKAAPAKGSIVRNSNRIKFTPTESKWDQQKLTMIAEVKVGDQSYGNVEFQGIKKDSKVLLVPTKSELKDKVKAQIICTSEVGCDEFFIDIFANEEDVLYHDQVLSTLKALPPTPEPVVAEPPPATPKKEEAQPPHKAPDQSTKDQKKDPKNEPPKVTPSDRAEEKLEENIIHDEIKEEEITRMGYVGTSDEEAREAFQIKVEKEEPPKIPVKETTPEPTKAPVQETAPEPPPPKNGGKDVATEAPKSTPEQQGGASAWDKLKVVDQVIKQPDKGKLDRGTDFLKLSSLNGFHFFITQPQEKKYFGSFDLAKVLHVIGDALQQMMPGRKLAVTEISQFGGGRLRGHQSHQSGVDADIRYVRQDESRPSDVVGPRGQLDRNFLVPQQWKLFKSAFATGQIDVVFVDAAIKRALCLEAKHNKDYEEGNKESVGAQILSKLYVLSGHDNHFHIRVRCSRDNPRCQRVMITAQPTGC